MTSSKSTVERTRDQLAGFIKTQLDEVRDELREIKASTAATAKAIGGMPDRWTDRLFLWSVKSRYSYLHLLLYTLFCVVVGGAIQAFNC